MSTATLTDAELVTRAAAGDRGAFTEIYRRHVDTVHDHLTRWSRDRPLAADATQEAFMALLDRIDTILDGQAVLAWLLRTARNRAIDQLRRTGREFASAPMDGVVPSPLLTAIDTDRATTPESAAEASDASAMVWQIAAGLDERTFTVLDLSVRQGLSGPEIAEVMQTTAENANVLVHRMRERLSSLFGAVLLLRTGRGCATLAAITEGFGEPLTLAEARSVHGHADDCEDCDTRRRRAIAPMHAYAAFAQVRAPLEVHRAIQDAIEARFVEPPAGWSTGRKVLAALGACVLLLLGGSWLAPDSGRIPKALGTPLADVTAAPTPTPDPTAVSSEPTEPASITPTPSEAPSSTPTVTPSATATPDASPTSGPNPTPTPTTAPAAFAIRISRPTNLLLVLAEDSVGGQTVARVNVLATVGGADANLVDAVWTSSQRPGEPLLDGLEGQVTLILPERCRRSRQVLTVTGTDRATEAVSSSAVEVIVTDACAERLTATITAPTDGSTASAPSTQLDAQGRPYADVAIRVTVGPDAAGPYSYRWTTDQSPRTELSTAATDTVQLWSNDCRAGSVTHVLTVTVTNTDTGETATDTAAITIVPECPTVP